MDNDQHSPFTKNDLHDHPSASQKPPDTPTMNETTPETHDGWLVDFSGHTTCVKDEKSQQGGLKKKCFKCHKKQVITITCKCSHEFCLSHRTPESHSCEVLDECWIKEGKAELKNSLVDLKHPKKNLYDFLDS